MSSAGEFVPGRFWSLGKMLELQAPPFMGAVTEMRSLIVLINSIPDKTAEVGSEDRSNIFQRHIPNLIDALTKVGARSALASANRLQARLETAGIKLTYADVGNTLNDIESRFADHLSDIKLFVLNQQEATLFEPVDNLLGFSDGPVEGFSRAFPSASFEIEEAAKCIALGRYTAAVFHCMRSLECGIRALSKRLEIPDPTKPAEKNWGQILEAIRKEMERRWPKSNRLPNSTGAKLESLYATLDAVKNPWRNATMHVETIYAPHEALHITRCVGVFMLELMKHCDEDGIEPSSSPAMATIGGEISSDARSAETR
jgi:hypothetical protein